MKLLEAKLIDGNAVSIPLDRIDAVEKTLHGCRVLIGGEDRYITTVYDEVKQALLEQ